MKKKSITNYLFKESPKADKLSIWFTSYPTIIIFSVILAIQINIFWILLPLLLLFISILSKPIKNCEFCKTPLRKKVDGLIEYHIQCECVKNRWRPVWYSWFENIHNKIFRRNDNQ